MASRIALWAAGAAFLGMVGCGGGSGTVAPPPPPPAAIGVSVSATSLALGPGQTTSLTATVSNDSASAGVTWTLSSGAPGTVTTVDATHATYAPGSFTANGAVTITATSKTDSSKTASVTVNLKLTLSVTVSPGTSAIGPQQTVNLQASVANDPGNAGVTWALASGAGTLTTVDSTHATYTSPASIASAGAASITATSKTDTTVSGSAGIELEPVTITLGSLSAGTVSALNTSKLTATVAYDPKGVTWTAAAGTVAALDTCPAVAGQASQVSCGVIYTAPASVSGATDTITATSVSDPSHKQTATISLTAGSTWENLVTYYNGLNLHVVKPYGALEVGSTASDSGAYQADRVIFHEVAPGGDGKPINTEIWRLDDDSPPFSAGNKPPNWAIPGTLNRMPWNANGSEFDLAGTAGVTKVSCTDKTNGEGCDGHNYLFDAAASSMQIIRPTDASQTGSLATCPNALASAGYLPWDPTNPDLFYVTTSGDASAGSGCDAATGFNFNPAVYAVDITKGFAVKQVAALPKAQDPITGKEVTKLIQSYPGDNGILMVQDANAPTQPTLQTNGTLGDYIPNIYMVSLTTGTIAHQFPINFAGLAPVCPLGDVSGILADCTSFNANQESGFHDIYFMRDKANHFLFNYGTLGGAAATGMFWEASEDGSVVTQAYPDGTLGAVAGTPYFGHPSVFSDGTKVAYAGYDNTTDEILSSSTGNGNWVWQVNGITGLVQGGNEVASLGAIKVGHDGWTGNDPNYVVFDGHSPALPGGGCNPAQPTSQVVAADPCLQDWDEFSASPVTDPTGSNPRILVRDGQRDNYAVANGSEVSIDIGPVQSPDATKMMFSLPNNLWANPTASPSATDIYEGSNSTVYSTYMAVDHRPFPPTLTAAAAGGTLTWTAYTPHLEVAGYHVYRSTDGKTFTEVTDSQNSGVFDSIPVASICTADGSSCTYTDKTAVSGTTYDYAVTAQEWSGLESSALSNVMSTAGAQIAASGTTGFDTTAPAPPTGVTATAINADGSAAAAGTNTGIWKISWTASTSPDVRYYNIYYDGGAIVPSLTSPLQAQQYLIASPAAANTSYIYFQGNPNDVPVFGVIAVDRQDNFSTLACVYTNNPSAACGQ